GIHTRLERAVDRGHPTEVRGRVRPAVRAEEVHEAAGAEARYEPLACLVVDPLPALRGDRRVAAEKMAHDAARSSAGRSPPIPSDPSPLLPPPSAPPGSSAASSAAS